MTRWEINFTPVKRFVRGEHQPDISVAAIAPNLPEAKAEAVAWMRACQHRNYRFHSAREIVA